MGHPVRASNALKNGGLRGQNMSTFAQNRWCVANFDPKNLSTRVLKYQNFACGGGTRHFVEKYFISHICLGLSYRPPPCYRWSVEYQGYISPFVPKRLFKNVDQHPFQLNSFILAFILTRWSFVDSRIQWISPFYWETRAGCHNIFFFLGAEFQKAKLPGTINHQNWVEQEDLQVLQDFWSFGA